MMYAKAGIIRPPGGDAREISFDCSGLFAGKPAPTGFVNATEHCGSGGAAVRLAREG